MGRALTRPGLSRRPSASAGPSRADGQEDRGARTDWCISAEMRAWGARGSWTSDLRADPSSPVMGSFTKSLVDGRHARAAHPTMSTSCLLAGRLEHIGSSYTLICRAWPTCATGSSNRRGGGGPPKVYAARGGPCRPITASPSPGTQRRQELRSGTDADSRAATATWPWQWRDPIIQLRYDRGRQNNRSRSDRICG